MPAPQPTVTVFAYGSNLCTTRLRERTPGARPVAVGCVRGRRLCFHKRGRDQSAKADAWYSGDPRDCVWGVVYRLPQREKPILDRCESLGVGYDEVQVEVSVGDRTMRAWLYEARIAAIERQLLPFSWYHQYVVHGATEHALPDDYVQRLRGHPTLPDPRSERHRRNLALAEACARRLGLAPPAPTDSFVPSRPIDELTPSGALRTAADAQSRGCDDGPSC